MTDEDRPPKYYEYTLKYVTKGGEIRSCIQRCKYNHVPKENPRKRGRKRREFTEEELDRVKELREQGLSYKKISNETGLSVYHIKTILR